MARRKRKTDTRKSLLEATLRLISEKGYLGTTTREIAREAGVTEITLFRHFGSKERLFEEVLQNYTFLPRLKELLPSLEDKSLEDALFTVGIKFLETLKERKSLVKIMLTEINIYPEKVKEVYKRFVDEMIKTLGGYFRKLQNKGIVRAFNAEFGSRAFLGMVFSYFQAEEIVKGRNITKKEAAKIIKGFVEILVNGIKSQ